MKKQTATLHMIVLLGCLFAFHLLVLAGVVPYDIVWGGNLQTIEEMRVFETTALLISMSMLMVFVVKYRQLKRQEDRKGLNYLIWGFAATFFLGTIGNMMAESMWELIPGTAISLYATYCCVIIAKTKRTKAVSA